ncbi:hypothetical protein ACIRP7_26625 [Streptomyces sp. NPDC102270]|uniref:hypothetical protein n=1 Tax=Streptomyces sp. NPDC102270 TaxID=3366150 RepID=UPI0037F83095
MELFRERAVMSTVLNTREPGVARGPRQGLRAIAVTMAVLVAAGCSGQGADEDDRSTSVCDGNLNGQVFATLVGDSGVVSEKTSKFSPTKWTAAGRCELYGKEDSVRIDYLWHSDDLDDLDRYRSPSASTVKSFKVDSAVGYVEKNRAFVAIPCAFEGRGVSEHELLEVEVANMPPTRTLDNGQRDTFASAATIAARYLGGEVFKCSAVQSGADSGSASPSPSGS